MNLDGHDVSHLFDHALFASTDRDVKEHMKTRERNAREDRAFKYSTRVMDRAKEVAERSHRYEMQLIKKNLFDIHAKTDNLRHNSSQPSTRLFPQHVAENKFSTKRTTIKIVPLRESKTSVSGMLKPVEEKKRKLWPIRNRMESLPVLPTIQASPASEDGKEDEGYGDKHDAAAEAEAETSGGVTAVHVRVTPIYDDHHIASGDENERVCSNVELGDKITGYHSDPTSGYPRENTNGFHSEQTSGYLNTSGYHSNQTSGYLNTSGYHSDQTSGYFSDASRTVSTSTIGEFKASTHNDSTTDTSGSDWLVRKLGGQPKYFSDSYILTSPIKGATGLKRTSESFLFVKANKVLPPVVSQNTKVWDNTPSKFECEDNCLGTVKDKRLKPTTRKYINKAKYIVHSLDTIYAQRQEKKYPKLAAIDTKNNGKLTRAQFILKSNEYRQKLMMSAPNESV